MSSYLRKAALKFGIKKKGNFCHHILISLPFEQLCRVFVTRVFVWMKKFGFMSKLCVNLVHGSQLITTQNSVIIIFFDLLYQHVEEVFHLRTYSDDATSKTTKQCKLLIGGGDSKVRKFLAFSSTVLLMLGQFYYNGIS